MKRRTRLIFIGCATLGGTLTTAVHTASALPSMRPPDPWAEQGPRIVATPPKVPAATPRRVPAPPAKVLEKVTVKSGDTLTGIGARVSRTWQQLAAFNQLPNPDLIYADQVLTIPPANYVPATMSPPAPSVPSRSSTLSRYTPGKSGTARTYQPAISSGGIWACIAAHESGGNPGTNTGNGYYGMYQDSQASWVAAGGLAYAPRADQASAAAQTAVNQRIQAQQGWRAWPDTSRMCGV
jgi:LysM repeat protein